MGSRKRGKLGEWVANNALLLVFTGLFVVFLVGQAFCGVTAYNAERTQAGMGAVGFWEYVRTGNFLQAVFSNWQAAILQLGSLILFGIFLRQRGAPHSRRPGARAREKRMEKPGHPEGAASWMYCNSLSIAFAGLFAGVFVLHLLSGAASWNEQRAMQHMAPVSLREFAGSAKFWFATLQTWEAEYMAIALYFFLSIFLRQEGSPESKPTGASDADTGDVNE